MQDYIEQQELFLRWFKHYGTRSISQIRTASNQILNSFKKDINSSLFKVFYPLVRMGLLEFIGNGKYQVSNSAVLYYSKKQVGVGYNHSEQQISILKEKFDIKEVGKFGLLYIYGKRQEIISICESNNILYSEPNLINDLSNFPSIKDIVARFEKEPIYTCGEYYNAINHKWERSEKQKYGLYRNSNDSLKTYLRTSEYGDLKIFDNKINPEYRTIAEVYHLGIMGHEYLLYNRENRILTIKNINIPILIERVLRASSIDNLLGVLKLDNEVKYENIPYSAVKHLNRILLTKTKIE